MKTTIQFIKGNKNIQFIIRGRLTSAIEMLNFHLKLEVQQETEGVWDVFLMSIRDLLNPSSIIFNAEVEFFKGVSDVIYELRVILIGEDLLSEKHLGSVLVAYYDYFNFSSSWNKPVLIGDEWDNKPFLNLMILKN